jgi:hypothetical protein
VGRAGVQRGDRGLECVGSRRAAGHESAVHEGQRLVDRGAVPAGPVLVLEQDQRAAGADARGAARVLEQHQREQAGGLGLVGQQRVDDAGQPDRLLGELLADQRLARGGGVALGEDEVEHGGDRAQAAVEPVAGRLLERDAGHADLLLRADEPLGDRRLRDEQRAGDLGDGEAADEAQGQRHLRLDRERGMAAREHQPEPLVGDHRDVLAARHVGHGLLQLTRDQRLLLAQHGLAPQPVDRPALRRRHDPAARLGRDAVARPAVERDGVGVLDGLLRAVDVPAQRPGEDGDRAAELGAEGAGDRVGRRAGGGAAQP